MYLYLVRIGTKSGMVEEVVISARTSSEARNIVWNGLKQDGIELDWSKVNRSHRISVKQALEKESQGARIWATL